MLRMALSAKLLEEATEAASVKRAKYGKLPLPEDNLPHGMRVYFYLLFLFITFECTFLKTNIVCWWLLFTLPSFAVCYCRRPLR